MNPAVNTAFSRTVESGNIQSYVPQGGGSFKYDALSVLGDDQISAKFGCKSHEMVLNMGDSRRSLSLNNHTLQLPKTVPNGRLVLSYVAGDKGFKISAKLHSKDEEGNTHVTKFKSLDLNYKGKSTTVLSQVKDSVKPELNAYSLDAKDYKLYKELKADKGPDGKEKHPLPSMGTQVLSGSEQTQPTQSSNQKIPLNTSYKQAANQLLDKVFNRSLADKTAVYEQADKLKLKVYNELSAQKTLSLDDIVDYCEMINILHKRPTKLAEAKAKIDKLYPADQEQTAQINQYFGQF